MGDLRTTRSRSSAWAWLPHGAPQPARNHVLGGTGPATTTPTWHQVVGRTTPGPVCPDPHPIHHTLCRRDKASPAMLRSRSWSAHAGPRLFGPAADPSHAFQAGPHWMRCARPGRPDGAIGARERETPRAAISVGPMRNPLRYPGSRSGAVVLCPIECEIRDARQLLCN